MNRILRNSQKKFVKILLRINFFEEYEKKQNKKKKIDKNTVRLKKNKRKY